ncbi:hypothetical protein [Streptomyces sp. NPDC056061]|uniref:hypothetical protein n=1 Tax=Streptomyces sp. NPDC056061 TaxID=3345700 RepID=UPI0035DCD56F
MAAVLVLGVSCAGKSSLVIELTCRGLVAVDSDETLGHWTDRAGRLVWCPPCPDRDWLAGHRWRWDSQELDSLLGQAAGTLFVCGSAQNSADFIDCFELTVLLKVDTATILRRLKDPTRGNDYGRTDDTREHLLEWAPGFQARMEELGATVVDARRPIGAVADAVVRLACEHGLLSPN